MKIQSSTATELLLSYLYTDECSIEITRCVAKYSEYNESSNISTVNSAELDFLVVLDKSTNRLVITVISPEEYNIINIKIYYKNIIVNGGKEMIGITFIPSDSNEYLVSGNNIFELNLSKEIKANITSTKKDDIVEYLEGSGKAGNNIYSSDNLNVSLESYKNYKLMAKQSDDTNHNFTVFINQFGITEY